MPEAPTDTPPAAAPTPPAAQDWQRARSLLAAGGDASAVADALERLGLTTLAAEARAREAPDAAPDRIDPAAFAGAADAAAIELVHAGLLDRTEAARVLAELAERTQYRASDGSRVWRTQPGDITRLGGIRGGVAEISALPALVSDDEEFPSASVLIGLDPPALFERLWQASTARANGYAPRTLVCEPDSRGAVAALADIVLRDGADRVRAMLSAERAAWFIGHDAFERLDAWLNERTDEALPRRVHMTPGGASPEAGGRVAELLRRAHDKQTRLIDAMACDRPVWEAGDRRVRRVQLLTSRYTAYVRFSAEDLACEMRSLGIDTDVLQERDASSHANPLYFARRIDAYRPDLVVCINHLRPHAGGAVPDRVPMLAWIQDAMPHLMKGDGRWRASPNDFAAGFIYPSLRDEYGFASERTLLWTNPVSTVKFHPGPAGDGSEHLRCEIAMATRHSEPPRAYFERSVRGLGIGTPAGRAAQRIGAGMGPILDRAAEPWRYLNHELAVLTEDALRESVGEEPGRGAVSVLLNSFTLPLADLLFRQQAATWAAAIAERRGWRLHLYGRGWDAHPTLGAYGRPELTHGNELRASYQNATVHLHASVRAPMHQRIAEVSLSGGLPLVRRTFEDADRTRSALLHHTRAHGRADLSMVGGRHPGYVIANHPEAMRVACALGAVGLPLGFEGLFGMSPAEIDAYEALPPEQRRTLDRDPNLLLVDTAETTFADEAELERCVDLAMSRPRRDALSRAIAGRCRDRFGLDAFARAMLGLVQGTNG